MNCPSTQQFLGSPSLNQQFHLHCSFCIHSRNRRENSSLTKSCILQDQIQLGGKDNLKLEKQMLLLNLFRNG